MVAGVDGSTLEYVPLHVVVDSSDLRGSVTIPHPRMVDYHVRDWTTSLSSATPNAAQVTFHGTWFYMIVCSNAHYNM